MVPSRVSQSEIVNFYQTIQNGMNHCAYIHSVLHVYPDTVVLKSAVHRANTQFIITLCIIKYFSSVKIIFIDIQIEALRGGHLK